MADGLEGLQERLAMLEQAREQAEREKQLAQFESQFGDKWGKNPNISSAVLDEMNRRGLATGSSDGVVMEALEAAVEETLSGLNDEIAMMMEQLQSLSQSLNAAKQRTEMLAPEAGMPPEGPPPEGPPPEGPPPEGPPPEGPPPEGPPPEGQLSDERFKRELHSIYSDPNVDEEEQGFLVQDAIDGKMERNPQRYQSEESTYEAAMPFIKAEEVSDEIDPEEPLSMTEMVQAELGDEADKEALFNWILLKRPDILKEFSAGLKYAHRPQPNLTTKTLNPNYSGLGTLGKQALDGALKEADTVTILKEGPGGREVVGTKYLPGVPKNKKFEGLMDGLKVM